MCIYIYVGTCISSFDVCHAMHEELLNDRIFHTICTLILSGSIDIIFLINDSTVNHFKQSIFSTTGIIEIMSIPIQLKSRFIVESLGTKLYVILHIIKLIIHSRFLAMCFDLI